ncbi:Gfo/Idh/MocA family protein [Sinomonas atrocyanea]|uniref:Gfo/Idh/MocA family protein n=1 Tax=Sinomonas atrocyanea TaxID=37927 RepID=UPI00278755CB|nr:Gfo/Idh/MocA family oxidoreductase [Sinomonas atrocyanea]MDQ0261539.1 putative dehydrogenase [Sinomonas atrocyanea]MDR6623239.1 putative dehydrogenase [Sinomonas atrocyanea]
MPQPGEAAGSPTIGVGFLGAGPVTQAIHLPSLARLGEAFHVAHVMDVDAAVASAVAARVGAAPSASMDALLGDPAVDVVAICSPHQFHAAQVIAACRAGKKAVLCEKPFAVSAEEAAEIAAVSAETGVPILVGAMHTFDPGWLAAEELMGDLPRTAHTLRSSIVLPPNARFEDFATEVIARPAAPHRDLGDPAVVAAMLEGGILGLAIHDLPLVRRFVPDFADLEVLRAEIVRPFGYVILVRAGGRTIELTAAMTSTWKPDWTFEAVGPDSALTVTFTPSYVQAGSAVAELTTGGRTRTAGPFGHNGYEGEWRRIAGIVAGTERAPEAAALIDDLRFALAIVDGTRSHITEAAA